MKRDVPPAIDALVEEVASELDATVRAEDGIYHLVVPVGAGDVEDGEAEEPDHTATVTLAVSEDGDTIFATRHLCAYDETLDLALLLREVAGTIHVQLAIDDEGDLMLSGAAPVPTPATWLADVVQELADFAPELSDESAPS